jgi:hypothetical protein
LYLDAGHAGRLQTRQHPVLVGCSRASPPPQLDRAPLLSSQLLQLLIGFFIPDFLKKLPNRSDLSLSAAEAHFPGILFHQIGMAE